ncbi:hypothetical protein [Dyella sp. C11]|uniref:hypothetical protein n=1 Tax=Dyella sp. C11 TaxID=2126991 RepID=UPI000D643978|nr:hypothetical protein [Dyella sp. C11]
MGIDPQQAALLAAESQATAAWCQFIGSKIGLVVAIGVPVALYKRGERTRQHQARDTAMGMALVVRPILTRMANRLRWILKQWPEGHGAPLFLEMKTPDGTSAKRELWDSFPFVEEWAPVYDRLHLLDGAAHETLLAVARAIDVHANIESLDFAWNVLAGEDGVTIEPILRKAMVDCLFHTDNGLAKIGELLADKKRD